MSGSSTTPPETDRTASDTSTREQAAEALSGAVEQARTPLLAALGAGDLAARTVLDAVHKVRTEINERTESARSGVGDLPGDLNELRDRLDPAELRKRVDQCTKSAVELYGYLADRGEETLGRLQAQPPVDRARNQPATAQDRVGEAVGEVRDLADDVLGKVTRSTRSFGEKAARATEEVADATADAVRDAGTKTASEARSTARQAANRAEAAKETGSAKEAGSQKQAGPAKGSGSAKATGSDRTGTSGKSASTKAGGKSTSGKARGSNERESGDS